MARVMYLCGKSPPLSLLSNTSTMRICPPPAADADAHYSATAGGILTKIEPAVWVRSFINRTRQWSRPIPTSKVDFSRHPNAAIVGAQTTPP